MYYIYIQASCLVFLFTIITYTYNLFTIIIFKQFSYNLLVYNYIYAIVTVSKTLCFKEKNQMNTLSSLYFNFKLLLYSKDLKDKTDESILTVHKTNYKVITTFTFIVSVRSEIYIRLKWAHIF